ncbi:MAG: hypothetical protein HY335_08315 [Deinococcus sp.]|nr:hypothetical protein [Deinococcus sp.]
MDWLLPKVLRRLRVLLLVRLDVLVRLVVVGDVLVLLVVVEEAGCLRELVPCLTKLLRKLVRLLRELVRLLELVEVRRRVAVVVRLELVERVVGRRVVVRRVVVDVVARVVGVLERPRVVDLLVDDVRLLPADTMVPKPIWPLKSLRVVV